MKKSEVLQWLRDQQEHFIGKVIDAEEKDDEVGMSKWNEKEQISDEAIELVEKL